jgi:hypothetical protein
LPKESENLFYVAAFGRPEDEFRFHQSTNVINKSLYPSLEVQPSLQNYQFCLRAKVNSNLSSNSVDLIPTNCSTKSAVICRQKIFNPPLCGNNSNSNSSNNNNSNILANDPMKLFMDPMLLNQKEMLVKTEKDKFVNLFARLNKTAAFDLLFR